MLTRREFGLLASSAWIGGRRASSAPEKGTRPMDIPSAIGNTSIIRLRKIVPQNGAEIFVKLESENPTGSMKDRMALALISRAEADGRLKPGDAVVEYTGGSTGTSLALVCAVKGYRLRIVSSDAFSKEKLDHMAALGAELTLVPSEGGQTTKKLKPGHDRSRPRVEPGASHLLDRSAPEPGQHRGLPRDG
jgi:cysteine synthase A